MKEQEINEVTITRQEAGEMKPGEEERAE